MLNLEITGRKFRFSSGKKIMRDGTKFYFLNRMISNSNL